ncbi:MAG TPA: hypothetical protein VJ184_11970, partial [Chryseolinea sp.]|nr:hypothetical protein [Chryseolinea sp.]
MSVLLNERNVTSEIADLIEKSLTSDTSVPELRQEAFNTFKRLGIPDNKSEEYKDTPISRLLQKNFTFQPSLAPANVNPRDFHVPDLNGNVVIFINGVFSKEHSTVVSPETEVSISPLSNALLENPVVLQHLGKHAD